MLLWFDEMCHCNIIRMMLLLESLLVKLSYASKTLWWWDIETAAAAVDTRGYCSTTFAEQLAGCQIQVEWHTPVIHLKLPIIASPRRANAINSDSPKIIQWPSIIWNIQGQPMSPEEGTGQTSGIINLCFKHPHLSSKGPSSFVLPDLVARSLLGYT